MQILSRIKIGPFLVISSVLAVWTLLAVQHVQAHDSTVRLPTPSCGNLPSEQGFLTAIPIVVGTLTADGSATTRGGGVTGRGDDRFRYARITVPALTAGELRVFDDTATNVSDAVLCQGSSQIARSITSYTAHNTALAAAARADDGDTATTTDAAGRAIDAAAKATTAADAADISTVTIDVDGTPTAVSTFDTNTDFHINSDDLAPDASSADRTNNQRAAAALRSALSTARSALSTARSALSTARSALNTAVRALHAADAATAAITAAITAEQAADRAYDASYTDTANNGTVPPSSSQPDITELANVRTALSQASAALNTAGTATTAAPALNAASTALTNAADAMHMGFQIRASVSPGDEEYIVVVASQDPNTALAVDVAFHGAISAERRQRTLRAGVPDTIDITITAPGLLTLETTGNIDTIGMLEDATPSDIAQAESGGSGDNFKMVVPVEDVVHTVTVEGAGSRTAGAYTLDMDFNVAMPSGIITTAATMDPATSPWTVNGIPDDDTMLKIQRSAADGNVADEDYFQFRPSSSGLLTVNANGDGTPAPDANTSGTLFGAMGQGPAMDQRAGQIATDDNSGPGGTHFKFTVPVEGSKNYLVKVEGTDGAYTLEFALTTAANVDDQAGADTITLPHPSISGTIAAATATTLQTRAWYLFNIEESGTLYLETTGPTDVVGYLSGPDGSLVGEDDNSGTGTNFRIAVNVAPGLHILEVEGQTAQTAGTYTLEASFVAGPGPEPPTEPTTPTDPDPEPTDATGALGNPPPGSTRSGIGIISGWVCQASNVTITISPVGEGGTTLSPFTIGYGADRPDTVGECDHTSPDTGFGMAFNFNRLAEGQYQITAQADGQQIGSSRQFTVIHLVPGDDFPRDLESEPVEVLDFPTTGETTTLEWETESQGFVITDVQ